MNTKVIKLIDVDENEYIIKTELIKATPVQQICVEVLKIIDNGYALVKAPEGEAVIFSSQCAALYWGSRTTEGENENVEF